MGLLTRTFEGAVWSAIGHTAQSVLGLLSVAVIARWLSPEVYGVFGAAMLLIATAEIVTGGAFTQCLIQRTDLDDGHTDASFWTNLAAAIGLAALLTATSEQLLVWLNAPGATLALNCLAVVLVLNACSAVPESLLMRDLKLRQTSRAGIIANTVAAITGIVLAIAGAGIWALIVMELMRATLKLLLLWNACTWRPGFRGTLHHCRQMAGFNLSVLATGALARADQLLPRAIVATLLGPQALGYWLLARRLVQEVTSVSTLPLNAVAMAAVSRAAASTAQVGQVVRGLYRAASLLGLPMYAGLIATAPWVVPLVFGSQWTDAVLPLQILLLAGLRTCSGVFNVPVLRGMNHHVLPLVLLGLGVACNAVLMTHFAQWGLAGIAAAWLVRQLLTWPLACQFIQRTTTLTIAAQLQPMLVPLLGAVLMGSVVALIAPVLKSQLGLLPGVVISIAAGMLLYPAAIRMLSPALARQALALARAVRSRDRTALGQLLGDTPTATAT